MSIVKIIIDTIKVFILFSGCTLLFYYGIIWFNHEYEQYQQYEEPKGGALKVSTHTSEESFSWLERLLYFYQNGE